MERQIEKLERQDKKGSWKKDIMAALPDHVLDREMVAAWFKISPTTLGVYIKTRPDFPKPFYLSPDSPRWHFSTILAYSKSLESENVAN